ncbi:MAG: hypothetical protein MUO67_15885 [Anaerolineales bacterium]|nr:hypothetical protein [Anaerolineales bacterium]
MTDRTAEITTTPGTTWNRIKSFSISSIWQGFIAHLNWRIVLIGIALFTMFVVFLAAIQFSTPNLAGNDGYYHIKYAYLMRTEGLKPAFDWLPLTVLNAQEFVDHHFLYHVMLIPFTFGDLREGIKVASVLFPALSFLSIWWLLRSQKVPYAAVWSLGLLVISEAFLFRMIMPRAQSVSLLFLVWSLYFLLNHKYKWLLPLGFFYVWLYNAFPLLLVVVVTYIVAAALLEKQICWQPLAYAAAGVGLGLIVNPYFPENLYFIYRHIAPKLGDPTATSVGSEWYPYKTTQLMENSGPTLAAFMAGVTALGLSKRRMHTNTATSLFLVFIFGYLVFQSRRFIEYAPPIMLIFTTFAAAPLLMNWLDKKDLLGEQKRSFLQGWIPPKLAEFISGSAWRAWVLVGVMVVVLVPSMFINLSASRKSLESSAKPYTRYEGASAWLRENSAPGSRVFQTDWDDFPRLFFYNTYNTYTLGLDPTYMQLYDADLYDRWVDITKGKIDSPSDAIRDEFGGAYVISDLKHNNFLAKAEDDSNLIEVYRDEGSVVLQVLGVENAD